MSPGAGQPGARPARSEISRIRHELRTPINHILGYSEMWLEDGQMPEAMVADLRRIHAGGQQLQVLIGEYFGDENFSRPRDLHQLYHELRTPVNQIIGYSELLQDLAGEHHFEAAIADLQKIRAAASHWLTLMETYLIDRPPGAAATDAEAGPGSGPADSAEADRFLARAPRDPAAEQGRILVVDDDDSNRDMLTRRLRRHGYAVAIAAGGAAALQLAASQRFDLILLDLIMPDFDGFQVLSALKADSVTRDVPVIMLSALDEENGIARCIELGAEDYLSKPFNPVFLWARIGACLDRKQLRDRERAAFAALEKSQKQLAGELAEAAAYVRSLLPAPLEGAIETEWCFQPGTELGGDAFGYHWIDENHFAIYLIDVCGHGVGAALLSVSVLNTLRAQTLPGVDFRQPATVLAALNRAFPMERQNQLYFTAWCGVYRREEREMVYSGGGHPPALLFVPGSGGGPSIVPLRQPGPAIGCLDEAIYTQGVQPIPAGARLLVLSDGVFEIPRPNGTTGTWPEFVSALAGLEMAALRPAGHLQRAQQLCAASGLEDDFSLLEIRFQ